MNDQPPRYMAYLLRLWCVTDEEGVVWRASLEEVHTGERKGFSDVQLLYAFLDKQINDATSDAPPLLGETL